MDITSKIVKASNLCVGQSDSLVRRTNVSCTPEWCAANNRFVSVIHEVVRGLASAIMQVKVENGGETTKLSRASQLSAVATLRLLEGTSQVGEHKLCGNEDSAGALLVAANSQVREVSAVDSVESNYGSLTRSMGPSTDICPTGSLIVRRTCHSTGAFFKHSYQVPDYFDIVTFPC